MSYKDKYSITKFKTTNEFERLSISIDPDDGVMFLYIPDTRKFDHEHIIMTNEGLEDLYEWLTEYFKNKKD